MTLSKFDIISTEVTTSRVKIMLYNFKQMQDVVTEPAIENWNIDQRYINNSISWTRNNNEHNAIFTTVGLSIDYCNP